MWNFKFEMQATQQFCPPARGSRLSNLREALLWIINLISKYVFDGTSVKSNVYI